MRRCGDAVSEASEFAVDSPVAPVRVLSVEAQHESAEFGRSWWPPCSSLWWLGPVAGDKASVPADHRGGFDDQHHAVETATVERTRKHRKDGPIGGCESGSLDLSLQHEDLMTKSQDLGVSLVTGHQQQPDTGNQESEKVRMDR